MMKYGMFDAGFHGGDQKSRTQHRDLFFPRHLLSNATWLVLYPSQAEECWAPFGAQCDQVAEYWI